MCLETYKMSLFVLISLLSLVLTVALLSHIRYTNENDLKMLKSATCRAGTVYPSGASEFTPGA